jgi:hypothetical protein
MTSLLSKGPAWLGNQYSSAPQQHEVEEQDHDSYDEVATDAPAGFEDDEQDQPTVETRLQKIARSAAAGASYTPHTILGLAFVQAVLLAFLGMSLLTWVIFVR